MNLLGTYLEQLTLLRRFVLFLLLKDKIISRFNIYTLLKGSMQFIKKLAFEPLMDFKQTIMEVGNITKAATFKSFLHLSYKNAQRRFLWQCLCHYFHKINIFGGYTKIWILWFFEAFSSNAFVVFLRRFLPAKILHPCPNGCHIDHSPYFLKQFWDVRR